MGESEKGGEGTVGVELVVLEELLELVLILVLVEAENLTFVGQVQLSFEAAGLELPEDLESVVCITATLMR